MHRSPSQWPNRSPRLISRRAAFARPRVLLAAVAAVVAGSAVWAGAQKPKATAAKPSTTPTKSAPSTWKKGPVSLKDLSTLVRAAGQAKQFVAANAAGPRIGKARFGLTERDLTPGTISDDRQPAFSPTGSFIAFVSNRTNVAGTTAGPNYHIWIMNRDGSEVRPVTGLTRSGVNRDDNVDQFQPSFSLDGNLIAYKSRGLFQSQGNTPIDTSTGGNLFTVSPFADSNLATPEIEPPFEQLTFFQQGDIDRPNFASNGLTIVFGHTANLDNDAGDTGGEYDVFAVPSTGNSNNPASLRRLTGGTADPAGATAVDRHPIASLVSQDAIYFTSTRTGSSRIFLMGTDGSNKVQITNPADAAAIDEYAAPSLAEPNALNFEERVAFQSTRLAAPDDTTRDLNIWSLNVSTAGVGPVATPTPVPTPRLVVSGFASNDLYRFDPVVGGTPDAQGADPSLGSPENVIFGPDVTNDGFPEVLVANRVAARVDAYDINSPNGTIEFVGPFASDASLRNPTALVYSGGGGASSGFLYVGSGFGSGAAGSVTSSTNRIHRYRVDNGIAAPAPAFNQPGSIFSTGADGVTNGIEGLALRRGVLYASAFSDDKINTYNASSGGFLASVVAPGTAGLDGPTGLAFASTSSNLFVCSSLSDDIKQFNPDTGAPIGPNGDFVEDAEGATFGLNAPEAIAFGPDGNLYVTAFRLPNATTTNGRFVLRFGGPTNATPGAPLPSTGAATVGPVPGAAQNAAFADTVDQAGVAGLAFFPTVIVTPPPPGPTPTPTPDNRTEGLGSSVAVLESNPLSAPSLVTSNRLDASQEDRAADREPNFSRSAAEAQTIAQLAFASTRRRAAVPNAPEVNQGGGDDLSTGGGSDVNRTTTGPTHDIWTTATQDFTAPVLVPVGAGNGLFPVVAPGAQAPFPAPRVFEDGLAPNTPVRIAVVLEERESGLAPTGSVTANFFNADTRPFNRVVSVVNIENNKNIPVNVGLETKPSPAGTIGLTAFDNGPPSVGGNELQANAVRGDGVYYCEGSFTPPTQSDFYFDIVATDRSNNGFTYDNIWGFSNRPFVKSSATSDLFVSDYAQGQRFPALTGDVRFSNQPPVESYFLTNPATITIPAGNQPRAETLLNTAGLGGIDVWRVLCRGGVPSNVLQAYTPAPVTVITSSTGTVDTRGSLASASSCVIWGSPYTGTVFAGPGTLADADQQRRLSTFLNNGGRLFVSGRDVVFTLSAAGGVSNSFLRDELRAGFGGETGANVLTGVGDIFTERFTNFPDGIQGSPYNKAELNDLQLPPNNPGPTYLDASPNRNTGIDFINPVPGDDVQIASAYQVGGRTVGQRVTRTGRANGFQSRVVFFGFGFENVHRRYTFDGPQALAYSANIRPIMADNIRRSFKTGGISGQVVNDETNRPVPNFLIQIQRGTQTLFARTDANGNYEVQGLENSVLVPFPGATISRSFGVRPAVDGDGKSLNPGFLNSFAGTPRGPSVTAPAITRNVNFRVIPAPRVSVSGVATQSNGTFENRSDDSALPNVRVLIRSTSTSSIFEGGGRFVQLTTTDSGGRFSFSQVPTNTELEVIFNPNGAFESQGGDIPDTSGIAPFTSNTAFGRRVIPDPQRRDRIFFDAALGLTGNNFVLNDGTPDTAADDPLVVDANGIYQGRGGPILVPVGRTINGTVFLNSMPVAGASVVISGNGISRVAQVTTVDGRYAFFDVPSGTFTITATLPFNNRTLTGTSTVTVNTSSTVDPVAPNIVLTKQEVTGSVTVNGAQPGEPLSVSLIGSSGSVVATVQTDNAGFYRFIDVPVGTYTVRVTRRGRQISTLPNGAPATVTVATFTPTGPADPNNNNILPGTGGDAVAPTINIIALGLSGNVTVNGVGAPGLRVEVLSDGGTVIDTQTSGENGAFEFSDLGNGNFTLRSSVAGRNGIDTVSVPVGLDASQANVQVPLFLYSLRGQVLFNGRLTSGQRVEVLQNGRVIATVQTDAAGNFLVDRLVAVPDGTVFQVRATRLVGSTIVDQTPLTSITIRRGIGQPLIIDVPPLNLVTQTLSGRVFLNNRVLGGATVQLLRANRVILTTTSRADGTYTVADVPEGTFVLRATSRGDTVQRTVVVARGRNQTGLDLRLLLQSIRGRVLLSGVPLRGQVVELLSGTRVIQRATTDSTGTYTFTNLPVAAGVRASFVVRATRNGLVRQVVVSNVTRSGATFSAPNILLLTQVVRVTVRLNGVTRAGVVVELRRGTVVLRRVTSTTGGLAIFTDVPPFAYTVRAAFGGDSAEARANVVANGATTSVTLDLRLQTISGVVLVNSTPLVGQVVELVQGAVVRRATSTAGGAFRFEGVPAGNFVIRASRDGDTVSQALTITRGTNVSVRLVLRLQSVRGSVTLDGRPVGGILVTLARGTTGVASTRTAANGTYVFSGVAAGTYNVTASTGTGDSAISATRLIVVARGTDLVVPALALVTPAPPPGTEEFQPGSSFQISVPYADATAPTATTTVARAFSVPPVSGGVENYRLFRFNALTREYEQLSASSIIRRGEGYFLQPQARGVSIRRPRATNGRAADLTRLATGVNEFGIKLRLSASVTDSNNGFNLIGFPFDPARFTVSDWQNATVVVPPSRDFPQGRRFERLRDAVGAGVVSGTLFTLDTSTDTYTPIENTMVPFRGYYARTFVDNVTVILRAGPGPSTTTP